VKLSLHAGALGTIWGGVLAGAALRWCFGHINFWKAPAAEPILPRAVRLTANSWSIVLGIANWSYRGGASERSKHRPKRYRRNQRDNRADDRDHHDITIAPAVDRSTEPRDWASAVRCSRSCSSALSSLMEASAFLSLTPLRQLHLLINDERPHYIVQMMWMILYADGIVANSNAISSRAP